MTKMNIEMSEELLLNYLNGLISEDERLEVEAWYFASKENEKNLDLLYYTLFVSRRLADMQCIDVDKSLAEFKRRIEKNQTLVKESTNKRSRVYFNKRIFAAAIFVGIIFLGTFTVTRIMDKIAAPFIVMTNLGERAHVILPDGSKVWLNACSRVEYSSSLFSKTRKVNMIGEAYFEVKKDKRAPFIVNSNELFTRVLGTRFNIRANPDAQFITTTLLEGSIMVNSDKIAGEGLIMKPNQQLKFDPKTGATSLTDCPSSDECVEWIDGQLNFNQASLEEIASSLERYYNVHISFSNDKLKKECFTCSFETKESIYQILNILKLTCIFDYRVENRNIILFVN